MTFKKIAALFLVFVMVLSLIGCSKKKPVEDEYSEYEVVKYETIEDDSAVDAETQATKKKSKKSANSSGTNYSTNGGQSTKTKGGMSATDSATAEGLKANLDFNGEKVTILREWDAYPSGKNTAWDNWNKRVAQLEKKYNVDIVEKAWTTTLAQESLSGVKPSGNLYQVTAGDVWYLAKTGYISDWNDAMQKTGINMTSDVYHKFNVQMCNLNNKQYAVGVEEARLNTGILFNNDLIKPLGYDIYKLVDQKAWTWDKMTEIAKKFSSRYSNKSAIGINVEIVQALAISNGTSLVSAKNDGTIVSNLNSSGVKAALQQVYAWCVTDKLATYNYGDLAWNALCEKFGKGEIGMFFCQENSLTIAYNELGADSYGFTYLPMGPSANKYYAHMTPAYPYVVPKAYKDNAWKYLLLLDDLYALQSDYTKDDQFRDLWVRKFKSSQAYNSYKSMNRNITFGENIPVTLGTTSAPWGTVLGKLMKGDITPGVLVDTYNRAYNQALSDEWSSIKFTGKY